jgi:hypothetical protein
VLESFDAVPFAVRRVFTIVGVPAGAARGGHANSVTQELIVCLAGEVTIRALDGSAEWQARLTSTGPAAYIPPMLWIDLLDFAPGTILVVLTDTAWSEAEAAYYRDESDWRRALDATDAL